MRKSFAEKIREDFKPVVLEEKEAQGKARSKPVPGARLIPLSDIVPDPSQPRKVFDKEKLGELAESIKSKGVIEPITVRFVEGEDGYIIVTGERRFKAAKMAGLSEIPCIVKHLDDHEVPAYQLIENLQREDLSPIEEAVAFKKLLDDGFTQVKLSKLIGKSQPYVSQVLKVLKLPQNILDEARESDVSKEHLLQLVKAKEPEQLQLWEKVKSGSTAEEVKTAVKTEKHPRGRPKIQPWTWKPKDKSFTVSIRFENRDYGNEEIIEALDQALQELKG